MCRPGTARALGQELIAETDLDKERAGEMQTGQYFLNPMCKSNLRKLRRVHLIEKMPHLPLKFDVAFGCCLRFNTRNTRERYFQHFTVGRWVFWGGVGRHIAVSAATLLFASAAIAQIIPPSEQLGRERERFTQPPAPQAQPGPGAISLPSTVAPAGAAGTAIVVRDVRVTGSTIYTAKDFLSLYEGLLGKQVTVQAVYDLARVITAKYGNDGYVLSRAIVPPQDLNPNGATVHIEIVEGYVDRVVWPSKLSRYRDFFSNYAAKIIADRPVNIRTIERYMLLAGDLPGLKFATSLKASETNPAASTLVVEVTEKPIDAMARVDNRGTPARGPIQYLAATTLNNLLGQHEALTLTWASVEPMRELQYYALYYRQVLTSEGLTLFADASNTGGRPGTATLELLDYRTKGYSWDAGLSYPVIRSRERNLTISGLAFSSDNKSDILGAPFNDDRLRGVRGKIDADFADRLRGVNQFNLTFSQGIQGLGSTENGNPLASRTVGRVDFSKVEFSANRTQPLFTPVSVYLSAYAQYAFEPLLTPEQCGYGGRFFGRAFDPSQFLGDSCFEALAELRYDIPTLVPQGGLVQLYSFTDYGRLWTRSPSVGTVGQAEAASVGGGVRFGFRDYINVDLQAAKGVEVPRDWRFFVAITAKY
jgi:hemolysin activation/secretion protein